MYKIYINNKPLILEQLQDSKPPVGDKNHLKVRYLNRRQTLFQYLDLMEKKAAFDAVTLFAENLEQAKEDLFSIFKIVPAAGGVVQNENKEILVIFRRGFWDLPKGKVEDGETIEITAIREVQEEVGLQDVRIVHPLLTTFHAYREGEKRCLKPSHWFLMETTETEITVQTEEAIEKGIWITPNAFLQNNFLTYASIRQVVEVAKKVITV